MAGFPAKGDGVTLNPADAGHNAKGHTHVLKHGALFDMHLKIAKDRRRIAGQSRHRLGRAAEIAQGGGQGHTVAIHHVQYRRIKRPRKGAWPHQRGGKAHALFVGKGQNLNRKGQGGALGPEAL